MDGAGIAHDDLGLAEAVMAGLVPAIQVFVLQVFVFHVFVLARHLRHGCGRDDSIKSHPP
jgi:hypothetical protein